MARLPGINYGSPVPSMGRQDPMEPVRVARSQAAAAQAIAGVAAAASNAYEAVK